MRIEYAIKSFMEKYDREALHSIDEISKEVGLVAHKATIPTFNLQESFNLFNTYIEDYKNYKIQEPGMFNKTPHSAIVEHTKSTIENDIFNDNKTLYSELPKFINTYIEGVNKLIDVMERTTSEMIHNDVDPESIAFISEATNLFTKKLEVKFDKTMDHILTASGYNTSKMLYNKEKTVAPIFL